MKNVFQVLRGKNLLRQLIEHSIIRDAVNIMGNFWRQITKHKGEHAQRETP
jgi:hypothetical protein